MPGLRLSPNVSFTFSTSKMNKLIKAYKIPVFWKNENTYATLRFVGSMCKSKCRFSSLRHSFYNLYQPLSNFPDSDFHRRRQERPVMQDPAATYIEAKLGQEAVLPCFALGTPTPITRSVHMIFNQFLSFILESTVTIEKNIGPDLVQSGKFGCPVEPYYRISLISIRGN